MANSLSFNDIASLKVETGTGFDLMCLILEVCPTGEAKVTDMDTALGEDKKYCSVTSIDESHLSMHWKEGSVIQLHANVLESSPILKLQYKSDNKGRLTTPCIKNFSPLTVSDIHQIKFKKIVGAFNNLTQAAIDTEVEFNVVALEDVKNHQASITSLKGATGDFSKYCILELEYKNDIFFERGEVFSMTGVVTAIEPVIKIKLIKRSRCKVYVPPVSTLEPVQYQIIDASVKSNDVCTQKEITTQVIVEELSEGEVTSDQDANKSKTDTSLNSDNSYTSTESCGLFDDEAIGTDTSVSCDNSSSDSMKNFINDEDEEEEEESVTNKTPRTVSTRRIILNDDELSNEPINKKSKTQEMVTYSPNKKTPLIDMTVQLFKTPIQFQPDDVIDIAESSNDHTDSPIASQVPNSPIIMQSFEECVSPVKNISHSPKANSQIFTQRFEESVESVTPTKSPPASQVVTPPARNQKIHICELTTVDSVDSSLSSQMPPF